MTVIQLKKELEKFYEKITLSHDDEFEQLVCIIAQ